MLRKAVTVVVGLVVVLLVGLGAGYLWLRTTLPTISGSVTVAAGDSVTLTEIFGDRWTRVTNSSGAATISITTELSRGASKGAK